MCSRRSFWRGPDSLWCHVEHPGKDKRDRETDEQQHDEEADPRRGNIEDWKDLRETLSERPTRDDVGDRHTINLSPLQFLKEAAHNRNSDVSGIIIIIR